MDCYGRCQLISKSTWLILALAQFLAQLSQDDRSHISFLKKSETCFSSSECQPSFEGIMKFVIQSPVLSIAHQDRPFQVACGASDLQSNWVDATRHKLRREHCRLQITSAATSWDTLPSVWQVTTSMKYALDNFRVDLLGDIPLIGYTDHYLLLPTANRHISHK